MLIQIIAAFFATIFFSIMFNVNKKELLLCGIVGASGWAIYLFSYQLQDDAVLSSFLAALVISIISYFLAISRKNPVTIYQISGIIPIVPGAGMYKTLFFFIKNDFSLASLHLIETLQIAGAIAMAILFVSSITTFATKIKLLTSK